MSIKEEGKKKKEKAGVKVTEEMSVGPPRFSHEPTPAIEPVSPDSISMLRKDKKPVPILSPKPQQAPKPVKFNALKSQSKNPPQKPKSVDKPLQSDNPPFSAFFTPITLPSKIDHKEKKEIVSKIKFMKKSRELKVNQEKQLKLPEEKEKENSNVSKPVPPLIKHPPKKEEKTKPEIGIIEPPAIKEGPNRNKKLILIIILVIIAVVLLLVYLFLNYNAPSRRNLMVAGDVEEAYVLGDIVYVTLKPYDSEAVKSIPLSFLDSKGNSYPYIIQELSAEYQFNAEDLGLENLDEIVAVSGDIEYKPEMPPQNATPTPPANVTANITKPKRPGGGGGITPTPASCTNDTGCSSVSISCSGSLPYNCSLGADGCLDRVDLTACAAGWQCVNSTGCVEIGDCTADINCTTFFDDCSYGICNSTGRCEIRYNSSVLCKAASGECDVADFCSGSSSECFDSKKPDSTVCSSGKCLSGSCVQCIADGDCTADGCFSGAYRDYFCNSTNRCVYSITTEQENSTNGNCADGIDNDCDGNTDGADTGCGTVSSCGNNVIEGTEVCDGRSLGGKTCVDLGYSGGTLACLPNCSNYNTGSCTGGTADLSSCQTLNQAGKTYKLINDISITGSGDCFVISSSDITLDCQNHKITGASAQSAVRISAIRATVKNCVIENLGVSGNNGAIYISSNNATIINNQVKDSYKAIRTSGVSYLKIFDNILINNDYGIETSSLISDSNIEQNVIESSAYNGLSLSSNRGVIKNNNISYNQYGIYSSGTFSNNIVEGNNISRNDIDGVSISSSGNNNSFIENTISGNQGGINLGMTSGSNNLTGNTICSKGTYYDDISCFASQKKSAKNTCNKVSYICSIMGGVTCDASCGLSSLSFWTGIKQLFSSLF